MNPDILDKYNFRFVNIVLRHYTPREILDNLCDKVFREDVNALLFVNNKPFSDTSVPTPQYLSRLGEYWALMRKWCLSR